ncbi:hypothetical protein FD754_018743, partial [Muntiacus muntjak]
SPGDLLNPGIKPSPCLLQPEKSLCNSENPAWPKYKKITDILAKSEPKPGTPEDLQQLMKDYYSTSRSVIELEELTLPDSCFLKANDLTHSLSSYLKEVCPKWVKLRRNHSEKKSVLMLIVCGSAVRALELIRSMTAFKGDSKVMKLFAKHIKVQEQVKLLEKRVVHLGVGTPGRIKQLIKQGGLHLNPLKFLIFDWNWRDQKLRRMMDIPETYFGYLETPLCKIFSMRVYFEGLQTRGHLHETDVLCSSSSFNYVNISNPNKMQVLLFLILAITAA